MRKTYALNNIVQNARSIENACFDELLKIGGKRSWSAIAIIHKLSGWRITFLFKDHDFYDVKIENYQ